MDSMWLFAIKAFEVNKLRLFNILFSHFGSLCTLLSRWNVRMDAKGPKDGAQCKDRGCERKKAVNLNGSMLATELKQRSRVDSKHTHTMHMINQKRTKCERQWQWQKRAPNLWMCSIFLSLTYTLQYSENKIKINKASDVEASAYVHCLCVLSLIYKEQTCAVCFRVYEMAKRFRVRNWVSERLYVVLWKCFISPVECSLEIFGYTQFFLGYRHT